MKTKFSKNSTIFNYKINDENLIKLSISVSKTINSVTTKPKVLINYTKNIEPLINDLEQRNISVQVVKNLYRGIFSYVTKNGLFDIGLYFDKKNLTIFSGNGYFLSEHLITFFEKQLNDIEKIKKTNLTSKKKKFCNASIIKLYEKKKKLHFKNFNEPINLICENKEIKKMLKQTFKDKINFNITKSCNYYKLDFKNDEVEIFKNTKKLNNKIIIKEIEKENNTKIEKNLNKLDEKTFIEQCLLKKVKIAKNKSSFIFFETTYITDVIDSFFQILNLKLI